MPQVSMASIGRHSGELVVVRSGRKRKWKLIGFVLAGISLLLVSIIIVMTTSRLLPSNSSIDLIATTAAISINTTTDITTTETNFIAKNKTLLEGQTSTPSRTTSFDFPSIIPTTTKSNGSVIYTPAAISDFNGYDNFVGLTLSNSMYYNVQHLTLVQGYIVSVSLRLFSSWEGDDPLYLFAISKYFLDHQIAHRYPVVPERNNTEWQTIEIPYGKFPLLINDHLAIGMQSYSETNQIYSIRSAISIHGKNITNTTMKVHPQAITGFYGAAFTFILVQDRKRIFNKTFFHVLLSI
ncbi:unnamed protein product [Rotaria sp. Silwood2]|nr:unnamed protein product [Rotaria sp. Silwood2]CAF3069709.1 unnamed protein product [Rotaria sp. Silwood2]CAF3318552.1 unnamed protein product [Rotaria sp. Silwood2]CAF3405804.1 unnamed protein product [Rotaria sp. Silwood2]CAF4143371.1 unnamed protein product [Rotaria sp. Silwood2]